MAQAERLLGFYRDVLENLSSCAGNGEIADSAYIDDVLEDDLSD